MSRDGALLAGTDALSRHHSAASVSVVAGRAGWLRVVSGRGARVLLCRALAAYFLVLLSCSLVPAFLLSTFQRTTGVLCAAHPEGRAQRAVLWTTLTENRRGGVFHGISCRHMLRLWDTWPTAFDMGLSRLRCSIALDFICSFRANHGKKVFAEQLPRKPRGCSKLSGTQCLDSNWKYLKRFLPHTLSKKRSQVLLRESTLQWVWRYNNRTRTPADLLRSLARLFE